MRAKALVLGCLMSLALPQAARGQSEDARARAKEAYDRGVDAHDRGDHRLAAREFARADAIAPSAVALQAALDAAIDADDPALGSELLERSSRGPVSGALAGTVARARKKFAGRAGRIAILCPSAARCQASIDGGASALDVKSPTWVTAGRHVVTLSVNEERTTKSVEVVAEQTVEVGAPPRKESSTAKTEEAPPPVVPKPEPAPSPAPSPPPEAPPQKAKGLSPVVFWTGAGLTGAAAIGTVIAAEATRREHENFLATGCDRANFDGCERRQSEGESAQLLTNLGIAATAAFGAATVVIGVAFTNWSADKGPPPQASWIVTPIASGAAAGYATRF